MSYVQFHILNNKIVRQGNGPFKEPNQMLLS